MKPRFRLTGWVRTLTQILSFSIAVGAPLFGQTQVPDAPANTSDAMVSTVRDLQEQVRQLRTIVEELRSEASEYKAERAELRSELDAAKSLSARLLDTQPQPSSKSSAAEPQVDAQKVEQRVSALEESSQLLGGKLNEQYQTKLESASKYRVRLSGIVLLNLFSDRGATDNLDFPEYAVPATPGVSPNSFGATLRQSEIGLEVFGPRLAGARTSGDIQVDFSGGFPQSLNGANFGQLRLRTAKMRMDWERTSLVGGQDDLFFSPLSPDSLASLAIPALAYQGNLWGWIPQIRVDHRYDLSDTQQITVQAGILDNFTGEPPPILQLERVAQAGENSSQPAYAGRVAWRKTILGRPMTLGGAAYYSRQNWDFGRKVNGWAGLADWEIPLPARLSLSGEFYRGVAIGGIGGGVGRSVLYSGDAALYYSKVQGLGTLGGWSQLKFKATPKLEFNGAIGLDNPLAKDLLVFPEGQSYADPTLAQNRAALVNFIYRPRSDLLLSTEYRRLKTFDIRQASETANQINLSMGILF